MTHAPDSPRLTPLNLGDSVNNTHSHRQDSKHKYLIKPSHRQDIPHNILHTHSHRQDKQYKTKHELYI
jgi:hypothetical protein